MLELFTVLWEHIACDMKTLFTNIFRDLELSGRQKQGVIVCIPIIVRPSAAEDYRPITLLNTENKILARLIAVRLRSILAELIHPSSTVG